MFTQCPECGTAFRVTAEVLRQAAGKVRCGGCGSAFNALDFLSEQRPVTHVPPPAEEGPAEPALEPPQLEADEPPEAISAERSAALLKTLDELAGSDIRIEDTGIEWRVLDEEDESDHETHNEGPTDDTGSMRWFIDESPTPVDEQLSAEPGDVDSPEIFEPAQTDAAAEEMRFDDDTPLPDDFDFDFDSEPAESGSAAAVEVREAPAEPDTVQVDLAFGEPEDWEDLLGEVDEDELAETEATVIAPDDDEAETGEDEPLPDVDTQFATQAEAMGIDLSGVYAQAEESAEKAAEESAGESTIDDDLIAAAFEAEAKLAEEEPREESADTIIGIEEDADGDSDDEFSDLDLDVDELDDLIEARDKELVASTEEDAKLAAELGLDEELESEDDKPELVVPPLTEEEQTINMMIDQDLLAIAVEDEDGFASTIVQKQTSEQDQPSEDQGEEAAETKSHGDHADKDSPLVETIIMEGEFVRDAVEEERLEAERQKTAEAEQEKDSEADTGKSKRDERAEGKEPLDYRMVAGIAALALLLGAQFVHQSRESLAVYPAFNKSVGSVYRMLGKPVVPAWDVAGWRFEATKGSTDESDEMLTIYSRIGNKSGEALPYPLINVSLTDRFEDIIGSKVLEPGDYLAESLDTRQPVAPGETFSAVISIEAPDADATGFKLNVCYRQPGGRLRCAIDDFK
ncbi:MAG: DUF3426 domain-containing protein [Gammaproteobacteria bacterium]|jgi:predicted Zn finger-like uncharacterized protein|nr:DUF3426 domain-containing protein [Gammaproteobacteria bacterium]